MRLGSSFSTDNSKRISGGEGGFGSLNAAQRSNFTGSTPNKNPREEKVKDLLPNVNIPGAIGNFFSGGNKNKSKERDPNSIASKFLLSLDKGTRDDKGNLIYSPWALPGTPSYMGKDSGFVPQGIANPIDDLKKIPSVLGAIANVFGGGNKEEPVVKQNIGSDPMISYPPLSSGIPNARAVRGTSYAQDPADVGYTTASTNWTDNPLEAINQAATGRSNLLGPAQNRGTDARAYYNMDIMKANPPLEGFNPLDVMTRGYEQAYAPRSISDGFEEFTEIQNPNNPDLQQTDPFLENYLNKIDEQGEYFYGDDDTQFMAGDQSVVAATPTTTVSVGGGGSSYVDSSGTRWQWDPGAGEWFAVNTGKVWQAGKHEGADPMQTTQYPYGYMPAMDDQLQDDYGNTWNPLDNTYSSGFDYGGQGPIPFNTSNPNLYRKGSLPRNYNFDPATLSNQSGFRIRNWLDGNVDYMNRGGTVYHDAPLRMWMKANTDVKPDGMSWEQFLQMQMQAKARTDAAAQPRQRQGSGLARAAGTAVGTSMFGPMGGYVGGELGGTMMANKGGVVYANEGTHNTISAKPMPDVPIRKPIPYRVGPMSLTEAGQFPSFMTEMPMPDVPVNRPFIPDNPVSKPVKSKTTTIKEEYDIPSKN